MPRLLSGRTRARVDAPLVILVTALVVFAALAVLAAVQAPGVGIDARVNDFLVAHRTPALDQFFVRYTGLGQWFVLVPAALVVIAGLTARGRIREALFLVVVMGISFALNPLLKAVFARDRPPIETAVVQPGWYSFPSGHAMSSATLALALIVIAWPTRWRWPTTALAVTFAVLMGFSRLYLGVHWLTDVLAGWAMAVAVVTATAIVFGRVPALEDAATPADAGPAASTAASSAAPETASTAAHPAAGTEAAVTASTTEPRAADEGLAAPENDSRATTGAAGSAAHQAAHAEAAADAASDCAARVTSAGSGAPAACPPEPGDV